MATYYAQRKERNAQGQWITPTNYYYETENEAERQYHLLCANAIANAEDRQQVSVEYGSVEFGANSGVHKSWDFRPAEQEPEPEEA